jgi:hypothetical protein
MRVRLRVLWNAFLDLFRRGKEKEEREGDGEGKGRERIIFRTVVFKELNISIFGEIKKMILTATQEFDLAIKPVDKKGNAAQVDGVPVWASTNVEIVTVTAAEDGLSCIAKANKIGDAQISVKADADLGEGIRELVGVLDITVVAGEAATLTIINTAPREQV